MLRRSLARGAVVDPFGPALQGLRVGPLWYVPEPSELWLALLAAVVPFHQDLLCLTPGAGTATSRGDAIVGRAERHGGFLRVHRSSFLCPPAHVATSRTTRDSSSSSVNENLLRVPQGDVALFDSGSSPLVALPSSHYDCVCFTANSFVGVHCASSHAAHHLTECHRLLKPHGVLAVMGHGWPRLVANKRVERDFSDFCEHLAAQRTADEARVAGALRDAHAEVYFPFPSVRRKWFTAEYVVPLEGMLGHIRGWPEYQRMVAPDVRAEEETGALRCVTAADPLEPLVALLEAYGGVAGTGLGSSEEGDDVTLRCAVDWFLVLCDSRPANKPRLVSTGPGQGLGGLLEFER